MKFKEIVSITGMPGLFQVLNTRQDGLIVKGLDTNKTQFIGARMHQFSILENISIYTSIDSEPLYNVFQIMMRIEGDIPPPGSKASNDELRAYFKQVLPDHDEDQVYTSDIKKVVKWYKALKPTGLISTEGEGPQDDDSKGEEE